MIQKEVETELAKQLLAGKVKDGQTVVVDYDRDGETADVHARRNRRSRGSSRAAPEVVARPGVRRLRSAYDVTGRSRSSPVDRSYN